MKIAILGTRGIPNNYGGFEQCAEKIGEHFVSKGHKVTVYNTDEHPFKGDEYRGIKIKRIFAKESKLKIWGTFIYDFLCLKDAVNSDFDIILNLGYVPSALFFGLKGKTKAKFITNMDGLEWKRAKWGGFLKKFIRFCEKKAIKHSDFLIADNEGIKDFYVKEFNVGNIVFIPYGAELFNSPKESVLKDYNIEKYRYYLLIARLEPENNIETILDGYLLSKVGDPFLVVGNYNTNYGRFLKERYKIESNIRFLGGIYNFQVLSTLRMFSKLYFHGHSVGGTNPSLLEAMASGCLIVAHNNVFNRNVLGEDGYYFRDIQDIKSVLTSFDQGIREKFLKNNREKILKFYNWEMIGNKYLDVFEKALKQGQD